MHMIMTDYVYRSAPLPANACGKSHNSLRMWL